MQAIKERQEKVIEVGEREGQVTTGVRSDGAGK